MRISRLIQLSACAAGAFLLWSCGNPAQNAQTAAPTTTRVDLMVKDWERAKNYTKAYLDSADDKSIAFKASDKTPRTFGNQMLHLAEGNYGLVKPGTGKATDITWGSLEGNSAYATKADVSGAVMASYDYVIGALRDLNDTQLSDTVAVELFPGFNVSMTKEMYFNKAFEHQTHHRGQTAQYLRAQGKRPPEEMLF